ncbi:MAG: Uma2 family endonuclease [Pirellulales bacterium]|nr:Uma2 family endonuclease [Pirellulales bacterium]
MSTLERTITTAAQLLQTPGLGRCELVRGVFIEMSPAGFMHGRLAARVARILLDFVESRSLGEITGAETGFYIERNPDTVRAPDVGFIRADRLPTKKLSGFFDGPPDLAVEILSPSDRASEVIAKVQEWLHAGCKAVWIVDPETETITVHESKNRIFELSKGDTLSGGDVLPGFGVLVRDIFG